VVIIHKAMSTVVSSLHSHVRFNAKKSGKFGINKNHQNAAPGLGEKRCVMSHRGSWLKW
jgi:hypothetical protein